VDEDSTLTFCATSRSHLKKLENLISETLTEIVSGRWQNPLPNTTMRNSMLDHVIVTVSDITRSIAFYAQALKPLGITDFLDYKGEDGHPSVVS
jgi:hypothetical protein